MVHLTARMFCSDHPNRNTSLKLRSGQIIAAAERVALRSDWYSQKGDWLGCGDLSRDNIRDIARHLAIQECFIVLTEKHPEPHAVSRPTGWRKSPGSLGRECNLVITPGHWFLVSDPLSMFSGFYTLNGLTFRVINHRHARRLIASAAPPAPSSLQPQRCPRQPQL